MYLIPIAWIYVALMMAVAEATASNGTVVGAVFTFLLYGVLPVLLVLYLLGTPGRKRKIRAREMQERAQAQALVDAAQATVPAPVADAAAPPLPPDAPAPAVDPSGAAPDAGSHAAGATVAPVGKEA